MIPWTEELRRLVALAVPVMGAQVGVMTMGLVDTMMVGRISVEALAAASIANAWVYGWLLFGQGLIQGIDPLITQAHGAGRSDHLALTAQRGAAMALLVALPISLLFTQADLALRALGQDPALAGAAARYVQVQIPSVPCFLLFIAMRQYLQGRGLMRPALWITVLANLANAAANYLLIFGAGPIPAFGLVGAGIATGLTRAFMMFGLFTWILYFGLHRDAWVAFSWKVISPASIAGIFRFGFPVAIQQSLEIWAFSAAALIAGLLGPTELAAHTIVLNMAALAFMMPLGISQGTVTRVGHLLGARRPLEAQRSAWIAISMGGGVMCISACAFVLGRSVIATLYTADPGAIAATATIFPIAAAFQLFDGVQAVGCGVLRGVGHTRPAAIFNLIGYWVVGLPVGFWLAVRAGLGLPGLWWSLCLGLFLVAAALVTWIARFGPARARSIVE